MKICIFFALFPYLRWPFTNLPHFLIYNMSIACLQIFDKFLNLTWQSCITLPLILLTYLPLHEAISVFNWNSRFPDSFLGCCIHSIGNEANEGRQEQETKEIERERERICNLEWLDCHRGREVRRTKGWAKQNCEGV